MLKEEIEFNNEISAFLEHHGVKGQKWGIRKDRGHEGQRAKTKKIGKLDRKFAVRAQDPSTTIKVWNGAGEEGQKHLDRINNKSEYQNKDFSRDSPLRQKYYKEIQTSMIDALENSAKRLGTNASGTHRYGILEHPDGSWDITLKQVKHDDMSSDVVLTVKPNFDSTGHIISFTVQEKSLNHATLIVEDILEHHGIKGQKWGIRNKSRAPTKSSTDYKKSRELRKKSVTALTNKQLTTLNKRLELEQKHSQLNPTKVMSGKRKAEYILGTIGVGVAAYNLLHSPAGKAAGAVGKAAVRKNLGKHAKLPF